MNLQKYISFQLNNLLALDFRQKELLLSKFKVEQKLLIFVKELWNYNTTSNFNYYPANIRFDKDNLRTSRRPFQCNNFSTFRTSSRPFKDVYKALTKTSSRRLQDFEEEEFLRFIMTKTDNHFVISLDLAYVLHHYNA